MTLAMKVTRLLAKMLSIKVGLIASRCSSGYSRYATIPNPASRRARTLRAHTPPASGATVRVMGGARAVAEVADTGTGLSDDQLEHAFEPLLPG